MKTSTPPTKRWIWRHENELRRALSAWAVSQHPYHRPPLLFAACDQFVDALKKSHKTQLDVLRLHTGTLRRRVAEFCKSNKVVVAWNRPRKGKHAYVFTSRYDKPRPEYDFIDLDALAMNVSRQLLKDE